MVICEILRRSKRKVATLSQWFENARKSDQLCNPSGKNATVSTWTQFPVVDATLNKIESTHFQRFNDASHRCHIFRTVKCGLMCQSTGHWISGPPVVTSASFSYEMCRIWPMSRSSKVFHRFISPLEGFLSWKLLPHFLRTTVGSNMQILHLYVQHSFRNVTSA